MPAETRFEGTDPVACSAPMIVALLPTNKALQLMLPEHVRFDVVVVPVTVSPAEHVNAFENDAAASPTARVL